MDGTELVPFRLVRKQLLEREWIVEPDDWGGDGAFIITAQGLEALSELSAEEMVIRTPSIHAAVPLNGSRAATILGRCTN